MSSKQPSRPLLVLARGWPDQGCYTWSPFVTKLELNLRLSKVAYTVEAGSLSKGPTGKIPYVELNSGEGEPSVFGDSTLIVKKLVELGKAEELNATIPAAKRAQDLAVRALLEEKLYFYNMRERWVDNYYVHRDKILSSQPLPLRVAIGYLIYRKISATLHGQGTGRYSRDEVRAFSQEVWQALSDLLEESSRQSGAQRGGCEPFWVLGGPEPTEADTSLFGFIISTHVAASGPASRKTMLGFPTVLDYAERIHDRYFPDYEKWDKKAA